MSVRVFHALSAHQAFKENPGSRTVINHNPLPDITHEEFVGLLGPLLVPENYAYFDPSHSPQSGTLYSPHNSPHNVSHAPFDWLHLEGRSVKTSLNNITGIDGLARERRWRSHCVFSLDATRKDRQGLEAVSACHFHFYFATHI